MASKFVKGVALVGASVVASAWLGGANGAELAQPLPLDSNTVRPRPLGNAPGATNVRSGRHEGTTEQHTVYHEISFPKTEVQEEVLAPSITMPGGFGSRARPALIAQPAVIEAKPAGKPTLIPGQAPAVEETHEVHAVRQETRPVHSESIRQESRPVLDSQIHEVEAPSLSMPGGFGSRRKPAIIAQPAVIEARPSGKPTLIPGEGVEDDTHLQPVHEERTVVQEIREPERRDQLEALREVHSETIGEVNAPTAGLTIPGGFGSNRKPAIIAQPAVIEAKPAGKPELIAQGNLRGRSSEEQDHERHQLVFQESAN